MIPIGVLYLGLVVFTHISFLVELLVSLLVTSAHWFNCYSGHLVGSYRRNAYERKGNNFVKVPSCMMF